jgi:uncharacterized membrane protein
MAVLAYPLLVFLTLQYLQPRMVGLAFVAVLLWRQRAKGAALWQGLAGAQKGVALGLLLFSLAVTAFNSEALLKLMPVAISAAMLFLFGYSLVRTPSMIERFARLSRPDLPEEGVRYTRRVTWLWCGFFVFNGAIAAWTAQAASRGAWALYNGLISYLLMGCLFAGEWLYRRWRYPDA